MTSYSQNTARIEIIITVSKAIHTKKNKNFGPCIGVGGGGGYLTKFNTGRLRPEVQPLTLLYTILAKKVPLLYTFC